MTAQHLAATVQVKKGDKKMAQAWKKLIGNSNLIQAETDRAVLIKIPGEDLVFWHPAKLVRTDGRSGYRLSISYTDDFIFKVFKPGKGKHNKSERYNEHEISAEEMSEHFE